MNIISVLLTAFFGFANIFGTKVPLQVCLPVSNDIVTFSNYTFTVIPTDAGIPIPDKTTYVYIWDMTGTKMNNEFDVDNCGNALFSGKKDGQTDIYTVNLVTGASRKITHTEGFGESQPIYINHGRIAMTQSDGVHINVVSTDMYGMNPVTVAENANNPSYDSVAGVVRYHDMATGTFPGTGITADTIQFLPHGIKLLSEGPDFSVLSPSSIHDFGQFLSVSFEAGGDNLAAMIALDGTLVTTKVDPDTKLPYGQETRIAINQPLTTVHWIQITKP